MFTCVFLPSNHEYTSNSAEIFEIVYEIIIVLIIIEYENENGYGDNENGINIKVIKPSRRNANHVNSIGLFIALPGSVARMIFLLSV